MTNLPKGLFEQLLTEALKARLETIDPKLIQLEDLEAAEAPDRIASHISKILEHAIKILSDSDRLNVGLDLARRLVELIDQETEAPLPPGKLLRAILSHRPDGSVEEACRPLTPLLDSTLLTNSPGEPHIGRQLATEIPSADRIDIVMAFIRRSGLITFEERLRHHCRAGRPLRVLTTTYTGTTEAAALDMLKEMGADIRVSYELGSTRLHAKAWLFHRNSNASTAFIGSSNLTHSAQHTGLEWNVRVSGLRNPGILDKMTAVFETYWNNPDFEPYVRDEFIARTQRQESDPSEFILSPLEIRLEPYQERLLEQIEVCREQGKHRNLLVSATGTGKTVMAAIDYVRLRSNLKRSRLLFVAHRGEILDQARRTFAQALMDPKFGELWVGGRRPEDFEYVFASIQSLHANGLKELDPHHFDVVIVDEFHHAAAPTYQTLLQHVRPQELLALTATPERTDGLPLLELFEGRISAELRLWDAIDQHRLCPFVYFGIYDGTELSQIPWRRGSGYDVDALSNLLTRSDSWANLVLKEVSKHVDNVQSFKALGFCVSIQHAQYMAKVFKEAGVPCAAIWGDTPEVERKAALTELRDGMIKVVFSVDLFNEGVDVPTVDTLLMLRPTDSPILFIQQLGRGLRLSRGKNRCLVLDFVGNHHKEFRFDRRFQALLGGTRKFLQEQVEQGFPLLPAGCHMELDKVATEIVLQNIKEATPSKWRAKVEELRRYARSSREVSLEGYLKEATLELEDVYQGGRSWSDLCGEAGLPLEPDGPHEELLRRACGRLLHMDDSSRLSAYDGFLQSNNAPKVSKLDERHRRLLRMLVGSVADQVLEKNATVQEACELLWKHPQVRTELRQLLQALKSRKSHMHIEIESKPEVPLQIHARYTRLEILSAMGVGSQARIVTWQSGVWWAEEAKTDLFAFTLDKTSGNFSPTTRYRDYAISPELFHWESQSTTRADGETGQRYQNHVAMGTKVFLFTRLHQSDRAFWFLGPATYVKHESEMPMAITWKLQYPMPGDLFAQFAAAVS